MRTASRSSRARPSSRAIASARSAAAAARVGGVRVEHGQQHVLGLAAAPDMRPAFFCAYMRWSAMRRASSESVASVGSVIEP